MIREEDFQIIHCHGARANLTGAILRRKVRVPIVTTVHSDYRLDYLGRPLHRLTYGTINTIALRMFDYHIGVSDAMAQLLISRGFDPQTLFAIYNGMDFTPANARASRAGGLSRQPRYGAGGAGRYGRLRHRRPARPGEGYAQRSSAALPSPCRDHPQYPPADRRRGRGAPDARSTCRADLPARARSCFAGWVTDTDSFYNAHRRQHAHVSSPRPSPTPSPRARACAARPSRRIGRRHPVYDRVTA